MDSVDTDMLKTQEKEDLYQKKLAMSPTNSDAASEDKG
jgi:hypothetical protein